MIDKAQKDFRDHPSPETATAYLDAVRKEWERGAVDPITADTHIKEVRTWTGFQLKEAAYGNPSF